MSRFLWAMPEVAEVPGVIGCWQKEIGSWRGDIAPPTGKVTTSHDKLGRQPVTPEVACSRSVIDTDTKVLVYLEVKMRWIHAVISPDRS